VKKRFLAILLTFIMLFQAVPAQVFAAGNTGEAPLDVENLIVPEEEADVPILAAEPAGDNSRDYNRNTGYPEDLENQVYIAIYDGTGFPGEPAWYPQDNYTFFNSNFREGTPYANSAENVLKPEILEGLTQGPTTDGVKVWGHYSATGTNDFFKEGSALTLRSNEEKIIRTVKNLGQNADVSQYKIIWYVIKFQTDTYWHIDGLVVEKETYNVNYYGNGNTSGNAPTGATGLALNASYTVKGNEGKLVKTNHTFVGWNTKPDGSGTAYAPGDKITITEDVSLYAQWQPAVIDELKVTKIWDDADDQDGIRPNSVTVHLLANGTHDTTRKVTLSADEDGEWIHTWKNLPSVDSNGRTITYTVEEEAVTGYTAKVSGSVKDGFTIANTHAPETTSVQAQKVWEDDHDRDGMRPDSVTLQLYKQVGNNAAVAVGDPAVVSNDTSWTKQWHGLPKNEGGQKIAYSVQEVDVPDDYTVDYSTDEHTGRLVVTNTYTTQKTSITVTKKWDDANNQDNIRPASVTVTLYANDKITDKATTLTANNGWRATFDDLPVYEDGEKIKYTVKEEGVPKGYTSTVDGYTITNSYTPETISIPVEKIWNDANNQDGKRPTSVTVNLLANGTSTGKTVTLNADNDWKGTFADLAKYSAGKEIAYTVTENTVAGYSVNIAPNNEGGYTITNTHTPETTEVTITKEWDDNNNQDGIRPSSITVAVYAGTEQVRTVNLTAAHNWKATVTDLPKYANGQLITYTVTEAAVAGYNVNENGEPQSVTAEVVNGKVTITNTHTPATTEVSVTKVWLNDNNNEHQNRPESITLHLLADEEHMGEDYKAVVSADEDGNWTYTWTKLPMYANGQKIQYSVAEEKVANYTDHYTHDKDNPNNITVTNTYAPEKVSVNVEKIWDDAGNQDGIRPTSVKVKLLRLEQNGNNWKDVGEPIELNADNGWEGVFDNLEANHNKNKKYQYTVVEESVPSGYTSEVRKDDLLPDAFSFLIINSHTPATTSVSVAKEWNDNNNQDGKRPDSITVTLKADGTEVQTLTLTKDNWTGAFTDLPKNAGGKAIEYTVEEVVVEGYTPAITGDAASGYTITNTHTPATTSVTVNKAWGDADNQDGIRPASVTVTLKANGDTVMDDNAAKQLTLSEANNWTGSFIDLPKFADGTEIEYTVVETPVEDYGAEYASADGDNGTTITVTNTHTPEVIDIPVVKIWEDANNQDGKRPTDVTVTLNENGQATNKTLTLSAANNWMGTFADLPKFASGVEIEYTVTEPAIKGYNVDANGEAQPTTAEVVDGRVTITNTHAVEKTEMTIIKVWDDGNNQDGIRPNGIVFHLLADGEHTEKTATLTAHHMNADGNWTYTWSGLDKYAAGKLIRYTVYEENLPDHEDVADLYDVSYKRDSETQITVTNSYTPATTTVTVVKIWDDGDNRDNLRPDSITVGLYIGGEPVKDIDGQPMTKILNLANGWSDSWTNLPKNANGNEIEYAVQETAVPDGYEVTDIVEDEYVSNEFIITNTHKPATTEVTVEKVWDDADDQDGIRPNSVRVTLYKDGVAASVAELNEGNDWSYTFFDLYKLQNGEEIVYTVGEAYEDVPAGYTPVVTGDEETGYTITNSHTPEVTEVTVTKKWEDADDQDGIRPEKITVEIYAGEKFVKTVELSADKNWSATVENLPKYANGEEIVYTVKEITVDGYDSDVDGLTITNSHTPETTSVSVTKVWDDADDQDGKRPGSINVSLYANGDEVDSLTLTEEDGWKGTFTDLPKYADGAEIVYAIEEIEIGGYSVDISGNVAEGFTITNIHTPEAIEVAITKVWEDNDDQDGIRPESVTVTLYAGDEEIETLTLTADNKWSGKFENLPKFADGKEIEYTVEEEEVEGYTAETTGSVENGFTITNTHEVEKTSVTATKVWDDEKNQDGKRPTEITLHLLADNEDTGKTAVLNAENEWTYTWTGLDVNADGKLVQYTVAEETVDGNVYTATYTYDDEAPYEITVTNTYTPEETSVHVQKVWVDAHNQDGKRPESVTLQLYKQIANGEKAAVGEPVIVSGETQWNAQWLNLPKYENGQSLSYSVEEKNVPEGYTVSYSTDTQTGHLIVKNTHTPAKTEVPVSKVWNDNNNQDGLRPAGVSVTLYANGKAVDTLTLTAAGGWRSVFEDLPKYANGKEITYTVNESIVPKGYTMSVDGYTITNTHTPAVTDVTVTKVWNDNKNQDGIRPNSITAEVYADGKVIETVDVTAEGNWKATITDLPKYSDGELIEYTVKEINVPEGYTVTVNGYTITNTHTPAKTEVSVSKVWNDNNNQDGIRPNSVSVVLYRNGVPADTAVLNAGNNWRYTFRNLDAHHGAGKDNIYTVAEIVPSGYVAAISGTAKTGYVITNIHTPDVIDIPVVKVWNDAEDQDGIRPDSITVILYADGEATNQKLNLTADKNWMGTFENLPMNKDGKVIEYAVEENAVEDYRTDTKTVDGKIVITNTHETEKTTLTAVKVWDDENNQDGKRPENITLHLLKNGVRMGDEYKVVLSADADGNWIHTWEDLDKYAAGELVHYTVYEEPVYIDAQETYTVIYARDSETQITITNAYTPETMEITASKVWEDADDRDGLRPESITVTLFGDDAEVASAVLNEENGWTASWKDLPKNANGTEIEYTVAENEVPEGYESTVANQDGQFVITNTHMPETTGVTVEKIWADENNNDGKRPDGIVVQLFADGSVIEGGKVVLNESNQWSHTWEDIEGTPLYVFNQGEQIHYYVVEVGYVIDGVEYEGLPEGYEGSTSVGSDTYTVSITNTYAVEKLSVRVVKEWADEDNNDGIRPDSVEMTLTKNGAAVETVTLSEENQWAYTWTDLYKYVNGEVVEYAVVESAVDGYTTTYAAAEDNRDILITVTNTHEAETAEITVTKVWKDNNDEDGLRPENITIQFYKNDEAFGDPMKLSADSGWKYTAELPVYENGEKITWSVKETSIPRFYTVSYDQSNLIITNTVQSKDVPQSGDHNNLWVWLLLMGSCTAGAATVLLYDKKRKYTK